MTCPLSGQLFSCELCVTVKHMLCNVMLWSGLKQQHKRSEQLSVADTAVWNSCWQRSVWLQPFNQAYPSLSGGPRANMDAQHIPTDTKWQCKDQWCYQARTQTGLQGSFIIRVHNRGRREKVRLFWAASDSVDVFQEC